MEANPCEAVKNNVLGTRLLAEAAVRHQVERFLLISTDKAVNPTSVMGATKRVTERIVASLLAQGTTVFAAVRFGNVLGSNGSVVPLFAQQIEAGGPVTVTHPEVTRYFMLIPEAVQLVLHAASLARGGEIFVLQMGEPLKLVQVARRLIRLAGLRPDRDVRIEFTGLRPGEKLHEALWEHDEVVEPSGREQILRVRPAQPVDRRRLARLIDQLEGAARLGDRAAAMAALRAVVPTFTPTGPNASFVQQASEPSAIDGAAIRGATVDGAAVHRTETAAWPPAMVSAGAGSGAR
jgi:FlaA1/EpsC-like NDP-sugar epimerase